MLARLTYNSVIISSQLLAIQQVSHQEVRKTVKTIQRQTPKNPNLRNNTALFCTFFLIIFMGYRLLLYPVKV